MSFINHKIADLGEEGRHHPGLCLKKTKTNPPQIGLFPPPRNTLQKGAGPEFARGGALTSEGESLRGVASSEEARRGRGLQ